MNTPVEIENLTYEQARDELVVIVAKLEAGEVTLEDSLTLWERGEALAVRCQQLLEGARDRITDVRSLSDDNLADHDTADAGIVAIATEDESE